MVRVLVPATWILLLNEWKYLSNERNCQQHDAFFQTIDTWESFLTHSIGLNLIRGRQNRLRCSNKNVSNGDTATPPIKIRRVLIQRELSCYRRHLLVAFSLGMIMLSDAQAETNYRHLLALTSRHRHGRATHWHNLHTRWTAAKKSLLVLALHSEKEDIRSRPVSNSSRTTAVVAVDKRNPILLEHTTSFQTAEKLLLKMIHEHKHQGEKRPLIASVAHRLHTRSGTRYPPQEQWWQYV